MVVLLVVYGCSLVVCGHLLVICGRSLVVCGCLLVACGCSLVICGCALVVSSRLWLFVVVACFSSYGILFFLIMEFVVLDTRFIF